MKAIGHARLGQQRVADLAVLEEETDSVMVQLVTEMSVGIYSEDGSEGRLCVSASFDDADYAELAKTPPVPISECLIGWWREELCEYEGSDTHIARDREYRIRLARDMTKMKEALSTALKEAEESLALMADP